MCNWFVISFPLMLREFGKHVVLWFPVRISFIVFQVFLISDLYLLKIDSKKAALLHECFSLIFYYMFEDLCKVFRILSVPDSLISIFCTAYHEILLILIYDPFGFLMFIFVKFNKCTHHMLFSGSFNHFQYDSITSIRICCMTCI